jgi:hypothetical protein
MVVAAFLRRCVFCLRVKIASACQWCRRSEGAFRIRVGSLSSSPNETFLRTSAESGSGEPSPDELEELGAARLGSAQLVECGTTNGDWSAAIELFQLSGAGGGL